ncbi:MAG: site-2 protease family protein [Nitratiruptor sp.]|nr:site-2 protease family protein [Nitratiruptor sp.]NPA83887.1 site-2 protease family protein [Campylobacterota bacterium]
MDSLHLIDLLKILATILALMVAIIGHEIMHALVAYRFGDPTAKEAGRLSINPIVHIDPVGTILVPALLYILDAGFLFGWAKPVPVNIAQVIGTGGEPAAIAVALAGVTYNFFLALLSAIAIKLIGRPDGLFELFLLFFFAKSLLINTVLGVFNLLPIPPLDGANALIHLARWLKLPWIVNFYEAIFPYGMVILFLVIATPLSRFLFVPIYFILQALSLLTGIDLLALIQTIERI